MEHQLDPWMPKKVENAVPQSKEWLQPASSL